MEIHKEEFKGFGSTTLVVPFVLVNTTVINSQASVELTGLGDFEQYVIDLQGLRSDGAGYLYLRVSTDNGSSWKSGASDYSWAIVTSSELGAPANAGDAADTQIELVWAGANYALGAGADEAYGGRVHCLDMGSSSTRFMCKYSGTQRGDGGVIDQTNGCGAYIGTQERVNGIQFLLSANNLATGTIRVYGALAS